MLFAGITVIISLMGLYLMGLSFVQGVALASSFGVAMMMAGSLTLLPALLGLVGNRIDNTTWAALTAAGIAVVGRFIGVTTGQDLVYLAGFALAIVFFALSFAVKPLRRLVPHRVERPKEQRFWYRWSRFIQHRPWPSALGAVPLLLVLAVPLFPIRLGFGDYGNYQEDQTVRRAYDLIAEGFDPGTNGPLFVTVEGVTASDVAALGSFVGTLNGVDNVAFTARNPIADNLALVIVYPGSTPRTKRRASSSSICATR